MYDQLTFEFDASASGNIGKIGSYYYSSIGWDKCNAGQNTGYNFFVGAFFRFDTSSIPDTAQIEKVEFRVRGYRTAPVGDPQTYDIKISIGDIIGGSLDGTAAEYNAGTHMLSLDARPADKTTLDLAADGNDPLSLVDVSGDTDIKILDHGVQGSGDAQWWAFFNKSTTERCKLYVYYSLPSATLTATCGLSCASVVEYHGAATLSATSDLSCAAQVTAFASATLTSISALTCTAMVTAQAAATLTSRFILSCLAEVRNILPMARHSGTRAVASADSSELAVSGVHSATRACDPDDVSDRGERRVTE